MYKSVTTILVVAYFAASLCGVSFLPFSHQSWSLCAIVSPASRKMYAQINIMKKSATKSLRAHAMSPKRNHAMTFFQNFGANIIGSNVLNIVEKLRV